MFKGGSSNKNNKSSLVTAFFFLDFRGIVNSNNKNKR